VELALPPKAAAVSRADHPQVPGPQDVGSSSPRQSCGAGGDSLDVALDLVKAQTTKVLVEERKMPAADTAAAVMAEWDCRVSQVVDVNKGLHCFTAKPGVRRAIEALPDRENGTYLVTVGRNADLNKAMDDASWDMINLLEKDKKLTRLDAYALASMVMDCRVAASRGTEKAVHCLVPKSTWVTAR
jgi:acetamidase/formamidase